jgi:two-component system, sensor histidine kinase and response regulator
MLATLANWYIGPFIPHGHCYLWKPWLVGLHLGADALIAIAYYSIPLTLVYFVNKRKDLPFDWIFLLFGTFIIACGTTHILEIWTLWHPDYWLSGFVKVITALISVCTAILLIPLMPRALALPSPVQLETEIKERKIAEIKLQEALKLLRINQEDLALRVEQRTTELQQVNQQLQLEIQERQLAEVALNNSEEKLNQALTAAQMGAWDWDLESDLIEWSDTVESIFGMTPGSFDGTYQTYLNRVHADDLAIATEAVNSSLETGTEYEVETRICTENGTIRWISAKGAVLRNANGKAIRMTGTVMDITKRKEIELALERERQQLQQIITNAPISMALFDTEMRYLAHSTRWLIDQEITGQSIIGRCHYDVLSDLKEDWKILHQRGLQGEILSASEDVWQRANGNTIYLRWAIHPWYTPDGVIGGIVVVSDLINELIEAREAALETARLKSEFLANMSHEIRTPMNGVLGVAGLLLQTSLTPQQLDYARTIRTSAENLLNIINDILDFSKLEAGEMSIEQIDFDLDSCFESVVDILATQAEEKGIELAFLVESNVPRQLQGDPGRLRQILLNLVGNALKFTAAGEVVVTAFAEIDQENTASIKIRFEVTDTGIGISEIDQKKLFQSFSQVDASTTRKYGGTGLGLVVCKQLVELMGGEIGIESVVGVGSTFWFTLPFSTQTLAISTAVPVALSQLKLLIVSDNHKTCQAMRSLTDSWGMISDVATESTETLNALCSATTDQPYDVAIIDLQSDQGALIVSMIRAEANLAQTKLIILTTIHQRDVLEAANLDISGYLIKPIRASRLFDSLASACGKSVHYSRTLTTEENDKQPQINSDLKILLVEDHPVNQMVILNQLQMLGYQADCVGNGKEAIAQLQTKEYDIVLMDCQMPVLDGYEATQEVRRREGYNRHTIIIALTAHALPADRAKCLAAGMDDYLTKPVAQEALGATIQRWSGTRAVEVQTAPISITQKMNESPLDLQRLNSISRGKVAFQQRLVQAFVDNAFPGVEQMRRAILSNDFQIIEQQAHRIKGASANVGVLLIPGVAAQLERQARDKKIEGAIELLNSMENQLQQVNAFLKNWR